MPNRLRLNTARTASVVLPEPAVGSLWSPCRPRNPAHVDALCLYLNSSIGLLSLLGGRGNRVPSYPGFSLEALRSASVPDFDKMDAASLQVMTDAFNELKTETLLPFPQMNDDPTRKRIDDARNPGARLDPEWVARVRRALAEEPSVTDKRYRS